MTDRELMQQALKALDETEALLSSMDVTHLLIYGEVNNAITALRERLAQSWEKFCDTHCTAFDHHPDCKLAQKPVACEPQYANEDGWCDWVCPKPHGYLMQCCDCGLIHEVDSRVARYEPRPSEMFEVVDDPDLQVQWRMKRRDDISPKQPEMQPCAGRNCGSTNPNLHSAECFEDYEKSTGMKQWQGLTDEEKAELDAEYGDDTLAHLDAIEVTT